MRRERRARRARGRRVRPEAGPPDAPTRSSSSTARAPRSRTWPRQRSCTSARRRWRRDVESSLGQISPRRDVDTRANATPMSTTRRDRRCSWLLLIHQIPPKPDYLRVKIGRRLQRVGAVAVKNSVYVLPDDEQSVRGLSVDPPEIMDGGGDASICRAEFVDGLTDRSAPAHVPRARNARLRRDRDRRARAVDVAAPSRPRSRADRRTRRRAGPAAKAVRGCRGDRLLRGARARHGRRGAERIAEAELRPEREARRRTTRAERDEYRGRTWVTRKGIFVDRIASAWLIRRFIDPDARFRFVARGRPSRTKGELRFDMFEAEFTHEGDRCTFETLLDRFGLEDAAHCDRWPRWCTTSI